MGLEIQQCEGETVAMDPRQVGKGSLHCESPSFRLEGSRLPFFFLHGKEVNILYYGDFTDFFVYFLSFSDLVLFSVLGIFLL